MKKNSIIYKTLRHCKYLCMRFATISSRKKMKNISVNNDFYNIVDQIVENKKSLARYGDDELRLMIGVDPKSYQEPSEELSIRLKEILNCNKNNILIGINASLKDNSCDDYQQKYYFTWFMNKYFKYFFKYFNKNVKYINASFTRIYMRTNDKGDVPNKFKTMKKIWKDKNIVFVEGEFSKLGVGNDLFDNTKSRKRIICPSKNAYSRYKDILSECLKQEKDTLFLIALGATATVLAYDLCENGYQALDIGHIDIEYEWYKMGATEAVPIKGKYTNETKGNTKLQGNIESLEYDDSIIKIIK